MVPNLIVRCGEQSFFVDGDESPEVTIGRGSTSTIKLDYSWLSRTHVRLDRAGDTWTAADCSRNGIYLDGERVPNTPIGDGTVLRLGDANGLEISFELTGDDRETFEESERAGDHHVEDDDAESTTSGEIDPDIARVGAAVAARRRQLDITQRSLAREKIINAGALIAFEKGRSWPRQRTRAALEEVLQWPPGSIEALRAGAVVPADEATQVIQSTTGAPLVVQTIKLALQTVDNAIAALPDVQSPEFLDAADAVLADLDDLRRLTEESARGTATPSAEIGLLIAGIRRRIDDVMSSAAEAPDATVGRRLYGKRRAAGMTAEDVAVISRLPLGTILAAEGGRPISPRDEAVIATLLDELQ